MFSNRRDAVRNRDRLVAVAREVFARQGAEVPLEEIARAASVSRTTLYRHFPTREDLAATVFEDNVAQIERYAAEHADEPSVVIGLFHSALAMQLANPALARTLSRTDTSRFLEMSQRTAKAFAPLVAQGRTAGLVHPTVEVDDLMRALPMAAAALMEDDAAGRARGTRRISAIRALFTTPPL
ncbi:TetR/AcrR family transcriptional regulator [Streptomyces flaveolus]|uniref:TetR/AcrR family transcriptional regulator n=1 Tax=Streptomyces flaveolus TaxID=67297 RepID=UPI003403E94B